MASAFRMSLRTELDKSKDKDDKDKSSDSTTTTSAPAASDTATKDDTASKSDSSTTGDSDSDTTSSSSSSGSSNSSSSTNATQAIVPATVQPSDYVAMDDRFAACTNPLDPGCLDAEAKLALLMSASQTQMTSDISGMSSTIQAMLGQQATQQKQIKDMKTLILGGSSTDPDSLLNKLITVKKTVGLTTDTVTNASQTVFSTIHNISNAVSKEILNIQTTMKAQFADIKNDTAAILATNAAQQKQALQIAKQGMARESASIVSQVGANSQILGSATNDLNKGTSTLKTTASSQISQLTGSLNTAGNNINNLGAMSAQQLGSMQQFLSGKITDTLSTAKADGAKTINATGSNYQASISQTAASLSSSLNSQASTLADKVNGVTNAIASNVTRAQGALGAASAAAIGQISDFQNSAGGFLSKLNDSANSGAYDMSAMTGESAEMAEALSNLLSGTSSSTQQAIKSALGVVDRSKAGLADAASSATGNLDRTMAQQLRNLLSGITSVQDEATSSGQSAQNQARSMIASAQADMNDDAAGQAGAVGSTLDGVSSAKALLNALIGSQGDAMSSRFSDLAKTMQAALLDGANTASEVGAAGQAHASQLQSSVTSLLNSQSSKAAQQLTSSANQQASLLAQLRNSVVDQTSQSSGNVLNLKSAISALMQALQSSQDGASSLNDNLNSLTSSTQGNLAQLATLLANSQQAAETAAEGAGQQVRSGISQTTTGLKSSIQQYATNFTSLFSSRLADVQSSNSRTIQQLKSDGSQQQALANDAQDRLNSLNSLLSSIGGPTSSSFSALTNYLTQMAQQEELQREQGLVAVQTQADGSLEDLRSSLSGQITQQIGSVQGKAQSLAGSVSSKVSGLMQILQQQAMSVASLESTAAAGNAAAAAWADQFLTNLNNQRMSLGTTTGAQLAQLDDLQSQLTNWSSQIDANITSTQGELQAALAQIPNITAEKLDNTAATLAQNKRVMQLYISNLSDAFEAQRAAEAAYVQQQSILRLSAILGIDQATLKSKVGLLNSLSAHSSSSTEAAKKTAEALSALADSVSASRDSNSAALKSVQDQITNLSSNTGSLSSFFATNLNKQFSDVYIRQQEAQTNLSKQIQAEAIRTGNLSNVLGNQLSKVVADLQNKSIQATLALATDQQDIFRMGSTVRSLGDDARKQLIILLHQVQNEVGEANRINAAISKTGATRISTVQGVMNEFAGVVQSYLGDARDDFTDIKENLEGFKKSLSEQIKVEEDYLIGMANTSVTATSQSKAAQSALADRMKNFAQKIQKSLNDLQEERSVIQTRNENEFQELQSEVEAAVKRVKADQAQTASDIQGWLDEEDAKIDASAATDGSTVVREPTAEQE